MTIMAAEGELGEILAVVRDFAAGELASRALKLDLGDPEALEACWSGVRAIGLERCLLGESSGGIGLSSDVLPAVLEELAAGDGGIATLVLLSNAALQAMDADAREAVPAGARCVLVPLPGPGAPGAAALTLGATTSTGRIRFALGAFGADVLVVVGRQEGDEESVFLLDAGAPGVAIERDDAQLGLRGAPAANVSCTTTPIRRLGGADAARRARILVSAGIAAIARGVARRAQDAALAYAENRRQGGTMIVEYGAIRDMIGHMAAHGRVAAGPAAASDDAGAGRGRKSADEALAHALAAKVVATDAAVASTTDAVQVFGGMGYMHDTGVEKLMRDARYCQLFPEANWLGREQLVELLRA